MTAPYPQFYGDVEPQMYQQNPFSGFPGLNNPMGAMVGQMLLQPMMQAFVGPGFVPGQFSPTQNYYDHIQSMQFQHQQQLAMKQGAKADEATFTAFQKGIAKQFGTKWTDDTGRRAARFSQDIARMMPMLGQIMPETADAFMGSRGSNTIMAQQVFRAGRFMFDPFTGKTGLSGDEAGQLSAAINAQLYGEAGTADGEERTRQMRGTGAGRAGLLMREMQSRGLLGGMSSPEEVARIMASSQGFGGDVKGFLQKEYGPDGGKADFLSSAKFQTIAKQFNAKQLADQVKDMNNSVDALRDLFGGQGKPNAPIPELLNNLSALLGGGMMNLKPHQAEDLVRKFDATMKVGNVRYDQAFQLNSGVQQMLQAAGRDTGIALDITQQAIMFGASHKRRTGEHRIHGQMTHDEAIAMDARLSVSGAGSPAANALNAIVAMGEQMNLSEDSELHSAYKAIKSGEATKSGGYYTHKGNKKFIGDILGMSELTRLAGEGGISQRNVTAALENAKGTEKYAHLTTGVVRTIQGAIDVPMMYGGDVMAGLTGLGLGDAETADMAKKYLDTLMDGSMDRKTLADPRARDEFMGKKLFGAKWDKMTAQEKGQAKDTFSTTYMRLDQTAFGLGKNAFINEIDAFGKVSQADKQRMNEEAQQWADMNKVFATTNKDGFGRRVMDFLIEGKSTDVKDLAARALGMQNKKGLGEELVKQLDLLDTQKREYLDPKTTAARRKELEKEISKTFNDLDTFGKKHDLAGGPVIPGAPEPKKGLDKWVSEKFPAASKTIDATVKAVKDMMGMPDKKDPAGGAPGIMQIVGTLTLAGLTEAILKAAKTKGDGTPVPQGPPAPHNPRPGP